MPKNNNKASTKEMDTQRLYSLLMPTSEEGKPRVTPYNAESDEFFIPSQPEQSPAALPAPGADKLDALRQRLGGETPPDPAKPGSGMALVNLTEVLVADRLDAAFEKFNCCRCDRCRKRAAAFALNELAPNYVAAAVEQIEQLLAGCPTRDVSAAIVRAVLRVKSTPEH